MKHTKSTLEDAPKSVDVLRQEVALQDRASALEASRIARGWLVGGPFILNGSALVAMTNIAVTGNFMFWSFGCFWAGFALAMTGSWLIVRHSGKEIALSEMELGVRDPKNYVKRGRQMEVVKRSLMVIAILSYVAFVGGVSTLVDPIFFNNAHSQPRAVPAQENR